MIKKSFKYTNFKNQLIYGFFLKIPKISLITENKIKTFHTYITRYSPLTIS